jgi:hypothetical protein
MEILACCVERNSQLRRTIRQQGHAQLPVVEDHLREGLATSGLTQLGVETERLVDREVSL